MRRVWMSLWAGLSLALFITAQAWADEKTETHSGKVVSVNGNQLRMLHPNGEEATHILAPNATVLCNGQACKLSDLKPGTSIRVTTPANDMKKALRVEAQIAKPAGEEKTETHSGKVVSVNGNQFRMSHPNGPEATHTLAPNATVLCNGQACKLSDLKPGTSIRVTTPANDMKKALRVEAQLNKPQKNGNAGNPQQQNEQPKAEQRQNNSRPYLGIGAESVQGGVLVRAVEPNSPAANAGLQNGDLIQKFDNQATPNFEALVKALDQCKPGEKAKVHFKRGNQEQDATLTVGKQPQQQNEETTGFLGVRIEDLTQEARNRMSIPPQRGALVVEVMPDTPAAKAGLQNGDVILDVDNKPINGPAGLQKAIRQAGAGHEVTLKVKRGEKTQDLKAHLESSSAE